MDAETHTPLEIRLTAARDALLVTWRDGLNARLEAALLRANTLSAGEKRLRLMGLAVPPRPGLTIADVRAVGHYAVTIAFSDGQDRGIYPWDLLRELAEGQRAEGKSGEGNNLTDAPAVAA